MVFVASDNLITFLKLQSTFLAEYYLSFVESNVFKLAICFHKWAQQQQMPQGTDIFLSSHILMEDADQFHHAPNDSQKWNVIVVTASLN